MLLYSKNHHEEDLQDRKAGVEGFPRDQPLHQAQHEGREGGERESREAEGGEVRNEDRKEKNIPVCHRRGHTDVFHVFFAGHALPRGIRFFVCAPLVADIADARPGVPAAVHGDVQEPA